jgi:hypothetical protein
MRAALVAVLLLAGCGPVAGAECAPVGGGVCQDARTLLSCELNGRFVAYACPGSLGCTDSTSAAVCDFTGSKEGDFCPAAFTGKVGVCDGATRFLQCDAGRFTARTCSSCTTSGLSATCQP